MLGMLTAIYNIQLSVSHMLGQENKAADLLSGWEIL